MIRELHSVRMGSDESKQRRRNYSDNEKSNTQSGALCHSLRSFQSHSIIHCQIHLDISNNPVTSKMYGAI